MNYFFVGAVLINNIMETPLNVWKLKEYSSITFCSRANKDFGKSCVGMSKHMLAKEVILSFCKNNVFQVGSLFCCVCFKNISEHRTCL